jgi:chromosome segregation ATPase
MSTVAKILVVLNLGLAAVFLGSASNYLGHMDNYKAQLKKEAAQHADTRKQAVATQEDLEGRLRAAGQDLTAARGERDKAQGETQRILAEVTHLREAYNQAAANATLATRSVDQLTNSLNAAKDLNIALQQDNNQLRQNLLTAQQDRDAKVAMVNSLQLTLENETKARSALDARLTDASEKIKRMGFELSYYQEKFPDLVATVQPAHSGRVLAVDNGANVFVISLGEEDGVKAGFQYIVSRGADYVATIQINDVQAKKSAGFAVKSLSKGPVNRNDKVSADR